MSTFNAKRLNPLSNLASWTLVFLASAILGCQAEQGANRRQAPSGENPATSDSDTTSGNDAAPPADRNQPAVGGYATGGLNSTGTGALPKPAATALTYLSGDFGYFASFSLNEPKEDYKFSCPGDAAWIGIEGTYDIEEGDRRHRAFCRFLSDNQGRPLRKKSCSIVRSKDKLSEDSDFSCPEGTLLAGATGDYDPGTQDRVMSYECCAMVVEGNDEKTVSVNSQDCSSRIPRQLGPYVRDYVNDEVNEWKGDLNYSCEQAASMGESNLQPVANAILHRIRSRYNATHKDRRFSFTCCSLKP